MKGAGLNILMRTLTCVLLLAVGCGVHAAPYFGAPIKATVVNSITGQPLEGVMVVATWDTYTEGVSMPTPHGHYTPTLCAKQANLMTALSGKDGVFSIPGWGPKDGCFTMSVSQPVLVLYKPAYEPLRIQNIDTDSSMAQNTHSSREGAGTVLIHSTSIWDGKTIKLTPAGFRTYNQGTPDPQIRGLKDYAHMLSYDTCFWDEQRRAFLLAMQDERRLSVANSPHIGVVEDSLSLAADQKFQDVVAQNSPWVVRCAPPKGYIEGLVNEADKTTPEVHRLVFAAGSAEEAFEESNPDPWALPAADLPSADDLAPGGAAQVAIIHHINLLYPEKPYYVRIYMTLPLDPGVVSGFFHGGASLGDVSLPTCGAFTAPTPAGQISPNLYIAPPGLDANGKVPSGYPACYLLKVVGSPDDAIGQQLKQSPVLSNFANLGRRPIFDSATQTYTITEKTLYRQQGVKVPEYIEIDGAPGARITTDLAPTAKPRRWLIPPYVLRNPCLTEEAKVTPSMPTDGPCAPQLTPKEFSIKVTMPKTADNQAVPAGGTATPPHH